MDDQHLHDAIDACRPGSDDLNLPEMASLAGRVEADPRVRELYQRSGQLDAAVARAYHDVPIPDGLAERLTAAVLSSANDRDAAHDRPPLQPLSAEVPPDEQVSLASAGRGKAALRGRPGWLAVTAVCSVVAVMLAVGLYLGRRETQITRDQVVDKDARQWTDRLKRAGDDWNQDIQQSPAKRPFDWSSLPRGPTGWRDFETTYDSRAVVFDLTPPQSQQSAVLFVVRLRRQSTAGFPVSAPLLPQSETGGLSVAAWKKGDLLYVLSVAGNKQRYGSFVQAASLAYVTGRH